jgi:hypothetical protein
LSKILKEVYQWEGGEHKERVNQSDCGGCILYSYENRIMKSVEIVLRVWEGKEQE